MDEGRLNYFNIKRFPDLLGDRVFGRLNRSEALGVSPSCNRKVDILRTWAGTRISKGGGLMVNTQTSQRLPPSFLIKNYPQDEVAAFRSIRSVGQIIDNL
jgi:hypothetical protein